VTKYLRKNINLKKERFISAHDFSPWSLGQVSFGPMMRHSIMVDMVDESCSPQGSWDAKRRVSGYQCTL
jgi:hypothetical protein